MTSSVAVIAEFQEQIIVSMHIRSSVPSVAMYMERMGLTYTRGGAQNVREVRRGSDIGRLPRVESR
jgi:hypothetical protein